jgi:putative redox protein
MNSVSARWCDDLRFLHTSGSGHALVTDVLPEAGGGSAPTPMELILHGLAGCTGVDVVSILRKMKQPLTGLEITVEAERADDHPRVYERVRMHLELRGDLDERRVEKAVMLSETKYCSVSAMLRGTAKLEITWEIVR